MKRAALVVVALLVLVALGAGGAYYLHLKHASRDVQGSSTVEFVPTETVPVAPKEPDVAWPMYGHDPERLRASIGPAPSPPFTRSSRGPSSSPSLRIPRVR